MDVYSEDVNDITKLSLGIKVRPAIPPEYFLSIHVPAKSSDLILIVFFVQENKIAVRDKTITNTFFITHFRIDNKKQLHRCNSL